MRERTALAALLSLFIGGGVASAPAIAGTPGCPEAGLVAGETKISELFGGFLGDLDPLDRFSGNMASIGDLDGDGVTDIAVSAYLDDDGGTDRGAVYVLFMNQNGTVRAQQKVSSTQGGLPGPLDDSDFFGFGVAGLGDLDGDGVPDLAVGAFFDDDGGNNRGGVYILFLNADGTVRAQQKISSTSGGFNGPLENDDEFGISVASVGDLNGDGVTELAVGARGDDDGATNAGTVYVLFLNANGTVRGQQKISATAGGFTGGLDVSDLFGESAASLGDLNGDAVPDIAVWARWDDDGGTDRGAVYILFLNTDGTVFAQQKISSTAGGFTGPIDNDDSFGISIARLGDLDNDGVPDIAVGASGDSDGGLARGAFYILFMNPNGTVKAERKISSTAGGFSGQIDDLDAFGRSVALLGDLDQDGAPEIAVGATNDDDGGTDQGALWIISLDDCDTAPTIVQNVTPNSVLLPRAGGITGFTIAASGDGTLSYQWRRDGVALIEGGPISGSNSPSVTIFASGADAGFYDCVVTNAFGTATSSAAILGVRPTCAGDANGDGFVTFDDITTVLGNFGAVCP